MAESREAISAPQVNATNTGEQTPPTASGNTQEFIRSLHDKLTTLNEPIIPTPKSLLQDTGRSVAALVEPAVRVLKWLANHNNQASEPTASQPTQPSTPPAAK